MEKAQPAPDSPGRSYTIKSLAKALSVLELLAEGDESAYTLTQLSRDLHLHISTVHRLLANLLRHGFVQEAPGSRGYQQGYKVLSMGLRVLARLDFRRVAEPLLRQLSEVTGETVGLAVLQGTKAVLIDKYVSPPATDLEVGLGEVMPFHATAVGKTLLAFQTREIFEQITHTTRFRRFTPRTIANLAMLKKDLNNLRVEGYALDQEEFRQGISSIAAPLFDHTKRVIAAFSVTGVAANLAPPRLPQVVGQVRTTGQQISFRLGYERSADRQVGSR